MDKVSYALGLGIGQQLKSMGAQDLCIDDFAQAIKDVLENKELAVSHHEAQSIVTQYFQEKEKDVAENAEKTAEIEMIKISAAVNSGRSPAEKQGQKQSGTRISVFSFSSGFPGIASALSRDTIFSKKIRIHG